MGFIVAIDGPAGSGKGTVAKKVADKIGAVYIDTGAMFRCIALEMLRKNIKIDDEKEINKILKNIKIEFEQKGEAKVFLNGENVTKEIRTEEVSNFVSPVSKIIEVREKVLILERKMAKKHNVIMEGRDIGTVVFPNAEVKIYLDASTEERAKRRFLQNQEKGIDLDYETILNDIKIRDERDMNRDIAPLKKADDAILIDSTNISIEEVTNKILSLINSKMMKNKKISKRDKIIDHSISKRILRAIIKSGMFAYCKIVYRIKIVGIENVPKDEALIFCGNHRTYLDPPLIEVTCKRDDTRFLAKRELTKNKFFSALGELFNVILVNRDSKDITALKQSLKTLKAGNCIALFPEGTRNGIEKGEKAKDGVAYFTLNSDAKVIPVGIKGGTKLFEKAIITYGKPIDFSEERKNKKEKDVMDKVTDKVMNEIIKLTK